MQFIDLNKQYHALRSEIDRNIASVLEKSNYIGGDEVQRLEKELADYCGVKHCLTCANGTDALTIALRALGVGKGDAVFVPDFTFFASAETPALEGATCVFVDVDERTFNMDPTKLKQAIDRVVAKNTLTLKCIVTVDLFGLPADYPAIRNIADSYGLKIIEDSAQGFGGSISGRKNGSFGDISTTSFFPAKPLGCYGDGGAIFTDDDSYYELMSSLAVHGKGSYKYDNIRIGYNSRLDTMQAAVLLPKLRAFHDYELESRNRIAEKYSELLGCAFTTPFVPKGFESSWAQYTLILESESQRRHMQEHLKKRDVPAMIYYPIPLHRQTAFKNMEHDIDSLQSSVRLSSRVLSIPMHPYLTNDEVEFISQALIDARQS